MKIKIRLENFFVPFSTVDWKLPTLCLTLVMTLQGYSQTELVKDINTQPGYGLVADSEYTKFAVAGTNLYYVMHGNQLWRTATAGTSASFVKEIDGISNLTNVNGRLFFTAGTIERGVELWKSEGTSGSTVLVKDIRAGTEGSSPSLLTNVGGILFFVANDGLKGVELWKSDGSMAGTVRVKDIANGSSYPSNLTESNGVLFFSVHDGQTGYEIWKSDGTSEGTAIIKDIRPGYKVGSNPQQFVKVNDIVYFTALTPAGNRRLFKTDGTNAGTALVSDVPNHVKFMTEVNGALFFAGTDAAHGEELWKSDGTAAGTFVVKDITPGPRSENSYGVAHLSYFSSMGGKLYFFAHDDAGQRLWVSNGTDNGTVPLLGPYDVSFTWIEINPIVFANKLYFNADLDGSLLAMMRTDGSQGGAEIFVEDVTSVWDIPQARIVANDFLYFVTYGNLWKTDGTNKYLVRSPFTSTQSSNPEEITDVNGVVFFGAFDGKSYGLWKSDATRAGTTLVKRFAAPVNHLTRSGKYLYYLAKAPANSSPTYYKLWRTETITGDTRALTNISPQADDAIGELADADGVLFFSAINSDNEAQLWKSGGEVGNTVLVKNFNNSGVPVDHLTTVGKNVFFSTASQSRPNDALWRSDGTAINTNIIKTFNTVASTRRAITEMIQVNQAIFYIAYDGFDYEIWKTNGSGSGTLRLKDIRFSDRDVIDVRQLTNIDNTLYFLAAGEKDEWGQYNRDLWKSNGTANGTLKIRSFAGALESPLMDDISILGGLNGSVLLGMQVSYWDEELWKTDGTLEGTQLLSPPYYSLGFLEPTVMDNILYFRTRSRLWRSDGTVCGTYLELSQVGLGDLTYSNGKMLLAYEPRSVGRELFIFTPTPSTCDTPLVGANGEPVSSTSSEGEYIDSYPNPFLTEFSVRLNGREGESYQVVIMDLNGIQQGDIMQLQFNMEYNLGARLRPGIYSLVIKKYGETITKKIVKSL